MEKNETKAVLSFAKKVMILIYIISVLAIVASIIYLNILAIFGWSLALFLAVCTNQDLKHYEKKYNNWLQKTNK